MINTNSELRAEFEELGGASTPAAFTGKNPVRAVIWDKSGGKCWYCGTNLHPFRNFSIDHFIPIVKGGGEDFDNLVPSCRSCNIAKGSRPLEKLRAKLARAAVNCPGFTDEQIKWLRGQSIKVPLPDVSAFKFYFERDEQNE